MPLRCFPKRLASIRQLWHVTEILLETRSQKPDTGVVGPVRLRLCGSGPDSGSSRYRGLLFHGSIIRDPLTNVKRKDLPFRVGVTYNTGMAKKTLPPDVRDFFVKMGGSIRAANMTAKQRSESARKAVQARWAKKAVE